MVCPVDLEVSGVETLRFCGVTNAEVGPLAALRAAGAFPETVCLIVSGDGVRGMLLASDDGSSALSVLRTSFNEILEPLDVTCHGDAEALLCT